MIKTATFNCNSIRARLPLVLSWLERERPDILCLQETKVQDPSFPLAPFSDRGYSGVIKGQKAYNGVAILALDPLELVRDRLEGGGEEARMLEVRVRDISLATVYVPQGFSPGTDKFAFKLRWLEALAEHLALHHDPHEALLLMGDFNVALGPEDVYDPEGLRGEVGFHPDEQERLRRILDWGLVDVFRKHHPEPGHYTFWDYRIPKAFQRRMGWRIDYILATAPMAQRSVDAWIDTQARLAPKPSDHTFVVAAFEERA